MKTLSYLVVMAVGFLGQSACGTHGLVPDSSPSALAAGDFTALLKVSGCGYQPLVTEGYGYCRVTEGPIGATALTFIAPPQAKECKSNGPCVTFTIFFPDGSAPYQDSIPYGKTSKTVPWRTIVKKDIFEITDRGFYPYTYTIRWLDSDGYDRKTVSEGEFRLRVIKSKVCDPQGGCPAYIPLRNAKEDSAYAWSWVQDGQLIRMTTAARTFVEYFPTDKSKPGKK